MSSSRPLPHLPVGAYAAQAGERRKMKRQYQRLTGNGAPAQGPPGDHGLLRIMVDRSHPLWMPQMKGMQCGIGDIQEYFAR